MRHDPRVILVGEAMILSVVIDPDLARLFPARVKRIRRAMTAGTHAGVPAELVVTDTRFVLVLPASGAAHELTMQILGRIDALMAETYAEATVARRLGLPVASLRALARARSVTALTCNGNRQGRRYPYAAYRVTDILTLARGGL